MNKRLIKYLVFCVVIITAGCGKDDLVSPYPQINDVVPQDALTITDPANDFELAAEGPASVIPYSPVDVRIVRLWKADNCIYVRVDFAGEIPLTPQTLSGETVNQQGFNVSFDSDNSFNTGAQIGGIGGIDIFFAVVIKYDQSPTAPYANYNFQTSDIHTNTGHLEGEFRSGGPGHSYIVYRFSLSSLGNLFPSGREVTLGGWSEAESNLHHHFAMDSYATVKWNVL